MSAVVFKILLIEDDPCVARVITKALSESSQIEPDLVIADRLEVGLRRLTEGGIEAVLLDLDLPDSRGLDTMRKVRTHAPDVAIVVLTGTNDKELSIQAMKEGAQDYLVKPLAIDGLLGRTLLYAITRQRLVVNLEQRERELEASEERLSRIIRQNSDGIVVVDLEGTIRFVNPAAENLFNRDVKVLLGVPFGFPVSSGRSTEIELIQDGNQLVIAEMQAVETTWEGEPAYLASLRDITNYKRLLTELDETRKLQLQTKDRFLSHISHELRSPLTVVKEFVSILLDDIAGELNPQQREYLDITLRNTNALKTMIDDLLELTRAQTGKLKVEPECCSLTGVISTTIQSLESRAEAKAIILSEAIPGDLPLAIADLGRIRQILGNLIENALKFTPENGTILVGARTFDEDPDFLCVSVTDSGCGINSADAEKVFEGLYQVGEETTRGSRRGLGLGLSICKELVSRHGGRIWVESIPGKGSAFSFTLPAFSLSKFLMPFVSMKASGQGSVALIALHLHYADASSPMEVGALLRGHAREILLACTAPAHAILFPTMKNEKGRDVLFAACCADNRGAEAVKKCICEELDRSPILRDSGLKVDISSTLIPVPSSRDARPPGQIAEDLVLGIQTKLRGLLSR